jgi:hypothetical protein
LRILLRAQPGFNLVMLLPQSPECWDYRCALPYLTQYILNCTLSWVVWWNLLHSHSILPQIWIIFAYHVHTVCTTSLSVT